MKRKFSKMFALMLVLVFALSCTVFAAESPNTGDVTNSPSTGDVTNSPDTATLKANVGSVTLADGTALTFTELAETARVSGLEQAATLGLKKPFALGGVDVQAPAGYEAGTAVDVKLAVTGVEAGQKVKVLHQKADGTWESLPVVKVENGAVTATFTSFSPVLVVYDASESTGSQTPVVLIGMMVLAIVAAGVGVCRSAKLKTE